jgi:hypothetical protein
MLLMFLLHTNYKYSGETIFFYIYKIILYVFFTGNKLFAFFMCASDVISLCWKGLSPLLWCLKWLLIGLFTLLLLPLILALFVLMAGLQWMGVDVNSEWPIVLICVICIIGLIWFCCHCCGALYNHDSRSEWEALKHSFTPMLAGGAGVKNFII